LLDKFFVLTLSVFRNPTTHPISPTWFSYKQCDAFRQDETRSEKSRRNVLRICSVTLIKIVQEQRSDFYLRVHSTVNGSQRRKKKIYTNNWRKSFTRNLSWMPNRVALICLHFVKRDERVATRSKSKVIINHVALKMIGY